MKRLLLFSVAMAFAAAAAGQQFKWVDKDGKTRYGDVPPPGVTPIRLKGPASGPAPAAKAASKDGKGAAAKKGPLTTAEQDAEFRKRQLEAQKAREKEQKAEQQAQEKKENCARAKEQLRTLEIGRVARTDAKGERYFLDEQQLAQEKSKANLSINQYCS